ncbi:MAG: YkgJ family cysteine cluster protein [Synergistaceae bacterium]|nr:YkgJ family cysteine cluster protein [Synergistaceae bacterium]
MVRPDEVKAKAQRLEEQNLKFRAFLKNRADDDELDAQFLELHKELFADYDCCKCANCCKTYRIILDNDEVKRISAFLGMSDSDFITEYLANADSDDEKPHKIKEKPCPFLLGDGRCRIQNCKPDVCAEFPYTDQPDRLSSMYGVIEHAEVCPVVFEILERLKVMYRFRNRR